MTAALEVLDLSVRLGQVDVVRDVSLAVDGGTVLGLVGPNGAGKTTLVDAVTGFVPASGEVRVGGRAAGHLRPDQRAALGVARTFQSLELFEDLTVGENLAVAAEAVGRGSADARRPAHATARARVAAAADLSGVGDALDVLPGLLPHGRRQRVALARALAAGPAVLLLDEPAAGLGQPDRAALATAVRELAAAGTAVVLVDHDVGLVLEVCDEVVVLDHGRVVAAGPPGRVRADPAVARVWLGAPAPAPARTARSAPARRGAPVLEMASVSTGYGGVTVVHGVDLAVGEGEVVALLGANGAGKTTTLRAACGALRLTAGSVRALGAPVAGRPHKVARRGVAHAPQDRGLLPGLTVGEQLRLAAAGSRQGVEAALRRLPAVRPLLGRRAGLVSGGEQQLLSLARALAARPRLLLVDELSLGLAPALVGEALAVLRALADDEGVGVVLVEQFPALALTVADRATVLARGEVALAMAGIELATRPDLLEAAYLGGRRDGRGGAERGPGSRPPLPA